MLQIKRVIFLCIFIYLTWGTATVFAVVSPIDFDYTTPVDLYEIFENLYKGSTKKFAERLDSEIKNLNQANVDESTGMTAYAEARYPLTRYILFGAQGLNKIARAIDQDEFRKMLNAERNATLIATCWKLYGQGEGTYDGKSGGNFAGNLSYSGYKPDGVLDCNANNVYQWLLGKNAIEGDDYGMRRHPIYKDMRMHNGKDIAAPGGTPLPSLIEGRVITSSFSSSGGYTVTVLGETKDGKKITVTYMHLLKEGIPEESWVNVGDILGYVGSTGDSTGNHLHMAVMLNGKYEDPDPFLSAARETYCADEVAKKESDPEYMNPYTEGFNANNSVGGYPQHDPYGNSMKEPEGGWGEKITDRSAGAWIWDKDSQKWISASDGKVWEQGGNNMLLGDRQRMAFDGNDLCASLTGGRINAETMAYYMGIPTVDNQIKSFETIRQTLLRIAEMGLPGFDDSNDRTIWKLLRNIGLIFLLFTAFFSVLLHVWWKFTGDEAKAKETGILPFAIRLFVAICLMMYFPYMIVWFMKVSDIIKEIIALSSGNSYAEMTGHLWSSLHIFDKIIEAEKMTTGFADIVCKAIVWILLKLAETAVFLLVILVDILLAFAIVLAPFIFALTMLPSFSSNYLAAWLQSLVGYLIMGPLCAIFMILMTACIVIIGKASWISIIAISVIMLSAASKIPSISMQLSASSLGGIAVGMGMTFGRSTANTIKLVGGAALIYLAQKTRDKIFGKANDNPKGDTNE